MSCHVDACLYLAPVAAGVLSIHHSSAVHEVREAIAQAATPAPLISPKAGECQLAASINPYTQLLSVSMPRKASTNVMDVKTILGKSSSPLQGVHVCGRQAKGVASIVNTTKFRCICCLKFWL